ncbi:hypothetical protein GCM10008938_22130 [Deinococcus roseus]|uniref:Uncharacterized protein n=2 Tax=Deinococcus roseus TaxID=392414 RepID=A0ABQ2CZU8_9DEIO|nr:hypothetical protein GCM10008938_22130 [Deinococcus roseus]
MIPLWALFISLHGPTSDNEEGRFLGLDPLFWGSMTSLPSLLLVLGWAGCFKWWYGSAGRMGKTGYVFTLVALLVPTLVDLITLMLGPPLLLPLEAVGLMLLAVGQHTPLLPRLIRQTLLGLGILLLLAFLVALVPIELSDRVQGYRIYGLMNSVLGGVGWMLLGSGLRTQLKERP